jgi:hypothetical protein
VAVVEDAVRVDRAGPDREALAVGPSDAETVKTGIARFGVGWGVTVNDM